MRFSNSNYYSTASENSVTTPQQSIHEESKESRNECKIRNNSCNNNNNNNNNSNIFLNSFPIDFEDNSDDEISVIDFI